MLLKEKIYQTCLHLLNQQVADMEHSLQELVTGMTDDTKSSAGDKHETARAMAQLEQEKINNQLSAVKSQLQVLQQLDISILSLKAHNGSLIKSDKGYLFLSVAIGKIVVNEQTVIVLSSQSPLGKLLMGRKVNEIVEMNGIHYLVEEIL